jgi:ABC-2 type transport system ATP-binding protein
MARGARASYRTRVSSDTTPAAVQLSGVTKRFRADKSVWRRLRDEPETALRPVLSDVSLEIARGEVFGLIGANGAGKSTLLKLMATTLWPDDGRIAVLGHDTMRDGAAVRAAVAVVPADERALFWRVSAWENVRLYAALHGLRGDTLRTRVDEALDLVGLGHVHGQQVGSFSSGMRQRVLVARAIVSRAPVLILDEPTRSLDPVTAAELRAFVRDVLVGQLGATIVLATHSTEEALALCTRAALLVRGTVQAVDTLAGLQQRVRGTRVRVRVDAAHEAKARVLLHLPPREEPPRVGEAWVWLDARLPADEHAPLVVEALVRASVRVAEFAPMPLTLADLLREVPAAAAHDEVVRSA